MISKEVSDDTVSSNSVNNDWKNWVVMHGSEKVAKEDVRSLGASIVVQFIGSHNVFGVLARRGKSKKIDVFEGEEGLGGSCKDA